MKHVYSLSNEAAKKHAMRFVLLIAAAIVMAVAVVFLGLKRWDRSQYKLVNLALLAVAVFCIWATATFGGALDNKANREKASMMILAFSGAAALAVWLFMTITNTHWLLSLVIFIADLYLAYNLCKKCLNMVKYTWNDLSSDINGDGDSLNYPGQYILNDVHINDSLTSPFGKVLIHGNVVLFVLVNQYRGRVIVRPSGALEIQKTNVLNDQKYTEGSISMSELLMHGEAGAQRMIQIVERECAKQGIDIPSMGYSFAIFMPNFEKGNNIYTEEAFRNSRWTDKMVSYRKYVKHAEVSDFFRGRACFSTSELNRLLQSLNAQYSSENPGATPTPKVAAECIAAACNLVPVE